MADLTLEGFGKGRCPASSSACSRQQALGLKRPSASSGTPAADGSRPRCIKEDYGAEAIPDHSAQRDASLGDNVSQKALRRHGPWCRISSEILGDQGVVRRRVCKEKCDPGFLTLLFCPATHTHSSGDAVCAPKKSQQLCDSVGTCKPSPGAHKACARGFFPREEPELTFRPWGLQREPNYFKETKD